MNYPRLALAVLAALVAYLAYGFAVFAAWPSLQTEFHRYPGVYRARDDMMRVMPFGLLAILVGIGVAAVLYARTRPSAGGLLAGVTFGAWVGLFVVCVFVIHNWVNLRIGGRLTTYQAVVYFLQWTVVGSAIGAVYRPA
jgi:hypothetical protein